MRAGPFILALAGPVMACSAAGGTPPAAHAGMVAPGGGDTERPPEIAPSDAVAAKAIAPWIPPEEVAPERAVWAYYEGARRLADIDDARARGFTIIDLSDHWVPYIFWSHTPGEEGEEAFKPNEYAEDYVRLANDQIDLDGRKLRPGEHNYLEVYGIPPTLSVLKKRFVADENRPCFEELNYALFEEYHGPVRVTEPSQSRALARRYQAARADFQHALREARVRTLEALLERPAYEGVAKRYQKLRWQREAIRAMQKRLACEGMYGRRRGRVRPGEVDWTVREALRRFERRHHVYGWGMIFHDTAEALGRSALENNYEAFKRVLGERVVSAAAIVEDGTARKATYRNEAGETIPVRDLVTEFTEALLRHMDLGDAAKALAFLREQPEGAFERLLVAIPLPPVPEYYGPHMPLSAVIDRGDIWYDLPFDDKGRRVRQPRQRMPHLVLYTEYEGQRVPLVRWPTTIGGWNSEMRDGQEYVKYKVSDVGPRVWRHIIAGPVWVPPEVAPSRDLVKGRRVRNRPQRVVAQSTFGPGYASAYGLVAAFHIDKTGYDNQIRTHGSVNYMSIRGQYSHGCHRLYNVRAVRLFSFILRHRNFRRIGQTRLAYQHRFEHGGEEFQINLHTRGYYYELTPPVPVTTLEGRIRGEQKEPLEDYVKKPGRVYQEDLPTHGDPGADKEEGDEKSAVSAPQVL